MRRVNDVNQQYCKQLKHLLWCPKGARDKFLMQAEKLIDELLQEQLHGDLHEIEAVLGTPEELVQTYLNSLDAQVLRGYRKKRKCIFAILTGAALLIGMGIAVLVWQKYSDAHPVIEIIRTVTEIS